MSQGDRDIKLSLSDNSKLIVNLSCAYQPALEHYNLKYRVLSRERAEPLEFATSEEIKQAIAEHALAYSTGDKAIITDLAHKQLLGSIVNRLEGKTIPAEIKARLFVIERFNANLINNYSFSRPIKQMYYMFSLAWFRLVVDSPDIALSEDSPMAPLLDLMLLNSRRIDHYSGADARHYCHVVFRCFLAYASLQKALSSPDDLLKRVQDYTQGLTQKRKQNSGETIAKLRKAQLDKMSREKVSDKVRETIGDGIYPIVLLDFIESYIALYLEDHYIRRGPKGEDWRQTIKDLSYLIWAFRADVDKNYRQYYPTKIPPAMHRLLLKVEPFVDNTKRLYKEFMGLEDIIHARYLGEYIKLDSVFNAPYFSSESLFVNQAALWFKQNNYTEKWFHVLMNNKQVIGRLLDKDQVSNQIVFLNYSGIPAIIFDTQRPDFQAEDVQVVPLREIEDWEYLFRTLEYEISIMDARFCESYQKVIQQIDAEKLAKVEELKKREAELEQRNFELREKILLRRQQKAEKRRIAEERAKEKAELEAEKRAEAEQKIERIKIGATIKAEVKSSITVSLQLNIITSTTGRYIFNDRNCQYRMALKKEELMDMMIANKIQIESYGRGEQYHQTLATVIAARRQSAKN